MILFFFSQVMTRGMKRERVGTVTSLDFPKTPFNLDISLEIVSEETLLIQLRRDLKTRPIKEREGGEPYGF